MYVWQIIFSLTPSLFLLNATTTKATDVSEFECNLEVAGEMRCEVGIHLKYVEQVVSMNLVQVAVGQRADVAT